MRVPPGSQFGPYRVDRPIARGSFALVYQAHDPRFDGMVAIKVLADNHAFDPVIRSRFAGEARALRSINDPHIVKVFDVGMTDSDQPYLVLELADRGSLADRLSDAPVPAADLTYIVDFLGNAMTALHEQGLVHRDIKPSNILIKSDGRSSAADPPPTAIGVIADDEDLLLADLGLAKDLEAASGLTLGVGSDGYAAPEQRQAMGRVDFRTDLFSATVLVARLLCGSLPAILDDWERHLTLHRVDPELRKVLLAGVNPDPTRRPATATAWRAALGRALRSLAGAAPPRPHQSRQRLLATVSVVSIFGALVGATLAIAALFSPSPDPTGRPSVESAAGLVSRLSAEVGVDVEVQSQRTTPTATASAIATVLLPTKRVPTTPNRPATSNRPATGNQPATGNRQSVVSTAASPTPSVTPTSTALSPTPSGVLAPAATSWPTGTVVASATAAPTPTRAPAGRTPVATVAGGRTSSGTATATATPNASPTVTAPPTATVTSTVTATPTAPPTATVTSTVTATPTAPPTATVTSTVTATPTATVTSGIRATSTATATPSATATVTTTPTATATLSATATPTATATSTVTATPPATSTATARPTPSPVPTATATATVTPTVAPQAIDAPRNLRVAGAAATWIELTWDNVEANAGYALFRDDAFIGYVPPDHTRYVFLDLQPQTSYELAVRTAHTDPNRHSSRANAIASTNATDRPPPNTGFLAQPTGVTTVVTSTSIFISWAEPPEEWSHGLLLSGTSAWAPAGQTSWLFDGLTPDTNYELKLRAMGTEVGDISEWLIFSVSTDP